jgi:hypothetical protein
MLPLTVPQQATAVRPSWSELPAEARAIIETRCGADVVAAESMGAGFTPGFASRLRLADGRRVFVKAADETTRGLFADSYREEIGKLRTLPDAIPARPEFDASAAALAHPDTVTDLLLGLGGWLALRGVLPAPPGLPTMPHFRRRESRRIMTAAQHRLGI